MMSPVLNLRKPQIVCTVNTLFQDGNDPHSYVVCRFIILRGRTLLFLVEVRGHLRSSELKLRKHRKWLVIAISQDRNDRHCSYLEYRFVMLRGRTLSFLVEVKGHLRSSEIKLRKPRKWLVIAISLDRND